MKMFFFFGIQSSNVCCVLRTHKSSAIITPSKQYTFKIYLQKVLEKGRGQEDQNDIGGESSSHSLQVSVLQRSAKAL